MGEFKRLLSTQPMSGSRDSSIVQMVLVRLRCFNREWKGREKLYRAPYGR